MDLSDNSRTMNACKEIFCSLKHPKTLRELGEEAYDAEYRNVRSRIRDHLEAYGDDIIVERSRQKLTEEGKRKVRDLQVKKIEEAVSEDNIEVIVRLPEYSLPEDTDIEIPEDMMAISEIEKLLRAYHRGEDLRDLREELDKVIQKHPFRINDNLWKKLRELDSEYVDQRPQKEYEIDSEGVFNLFLDLNKDLSEKKLEKIGFKRFLKDWLVNEMKERVFDRRNVRDTIVEVLENARSDMEMYVKLEREGAV